MCKYLSLILVVFSFLGKAATFNIPNGDVTALVNAINTANTNGQTDIINLAANGNYTLTAVNYTSSYPGTTGYEGQRGLPKITDNVVGLDLTINGNGATIERDLAAPEFGLFSFHGYVIFNDITFRNAKVNAQGGAIFVQFKGRAEVNNCKFYNNESYLNDEGGGGAIYTKSLSQLFVNNSYFENNRALNQGGAISNLLSNMEVINSTFKNNLTSGATGGAGGAIYDDGARGDNGYLKVKNCWFEGNSSNNGLGGALFLFPYNNNTVEVTGCTFKMNSAKDGGAYWHNAGFTPNGISDGEYPFTPFTAENTSLIFNSCIFDGNQATALGGGLYLERGNVSEMYDLTFKNNTALNVATQFGLGGAIRFKTNKPIVLRNSTFNNNTSSQAGAISFGIDKTATVINCTFDGNVANQYGGAVAVPQNDPTRAVTFTNCTFANNKANNPTNGQSGAIHSGNNSGNTSVTIKNCLFYNQTVTNTWGVWRHCNSVLVDGGNNLFYPENANGRCVSTVNPLIVDPLILPLASNGGNTQTMALSAASPAIDAGSGCPSLDQRGYARVGNCDIGAYEYSSTLSTNPATKKLNISIAPNPVKDILNIVNAKANQPFWIFNATGQLVKEGITDNTKINVSLLPKGIYFLVLPQNEAKDTIKLKWLKN